MSNLELIIGQPLSLTITADSDMSAYRLRAALTYRPGGKVIAVIDEGGAGIVQQGNTFLLTFSAPQTAPCRPASGIVLAVQLLIGEVLFAEEVVPLRIIPNYIRP